MEELIFGFLYMLAEFVFEAIAEVVVQFLFGVLVDAALHAFSAVWEAPRNRPALAAIGYGLIGLLGGALSLLMFPHPLVHPSRLHGINLVVSPVVVGILMSLVGRLMLRWNRKTTQLENFGYGFALAFGTALVRFFFVK